MTDAVRGLIDAAMGLCLAAADAYRWVPISQGGKLQRAVGVAELAVNAALAALEAAPEAPPRPEVAQGWQPIETAPMDGTHILLWWRTCRTPVSGRWCDGGDGGAGGWRADGDRVIPTNQRDCTHWMPLPAKPIRLAGDSLLNERRKGE